MTDIKALVDLTSEQTSAASGDLLFIESAGTPAKITFANLVDNNFTYSSVMTVSGTFTVTGTVDVSGGTLTLADGQIAGVKVAAATDTTRGTVEKSTSAENLAGTATDVFPDVAGVKEMVDANSRIVEIARVTLSSQADAEFTGFDSATYDSYEFELLNVVPASDGAVLRAQTSADGGTTYDSGASDYAYAMRQNFSSGTESSTNSSGSDSMRFHKDGVGSDTGETGLSGIVRMFGPGSATETFVSADLAFTTTLGNMIGGSVQCRRNASEAVDAIKFFFDSGNLESGTIIMRGIRGA